MSTHRPGDVLAGRYRLADLLSETGQGRFWLAHDDILGRPVAVHVLDADDPRTAALMEAARSSASIPDSRLLRVLDAETRDGITYVVNEWGRGTSLDILLARSGPVEPRHAAWIASEVAATLARAHELGHFHGRLNPENVLLDEAGAVRVIGFAVEAALYGLPPGTASGDVADLAGVLGAALTGTWSGISESAVPRTPYTHGHPLRPRQVRAGVPKVLDDLCDHCLNPDSRGRHEGPAIDARYFRDALMAFLGDPSDVAGREIEQTSTTERTAVAEPAPRPSVEIPTEASIPAFEDDDSWHHPRVDPAPPPPPLEPPAPKPLFASEPRVPRASDRTVGDPPMSPTTSSGDGSSGGDYWPFETHASERAKPGGRWMALGIGLIVLVLVVAAVLVVRELLGGNGGSPSNSPGSSASASSRSARPITGLSATDLDPQGDPPSEHPQDTKYAVDGKPATYWPTETYTHQLGPAAPALKSGVGIVVDLKASYAVSSVDLTLIGSPTGVSIYVSKDKPSDVAGLKPAATATVSGTTATIRLSPAAAGRYVTVWLTSLPQVAGGYRGEIAEVGVTGASRS